MLPNLGTRENRRLCLRAQPVALFGFPRDSLCCMYASLVESLWHGMAGSDYNTAYHMGTCRVLRTLWV